MNRRGRCVACHLTREAQGNLKYWIAAWTLIVFLANMSSGRAQDAMPDSTRKTLSRLAVNLGSRVNVLSISVRPGCEDFATLAYLRLSKGANIVSAYVSNGELGESDDEGLLPLQLGVVRRREATDAIGRLDGKVEFLNFPDIVAAADSQAVDDLWSMDSLRGRFATLIALHKPDIILLSKDRFASARPLWQRLLEGTIKNAIKDAAKAGENQWRSDRFLVEGGDGNTIAVPVQEMWEGKQSFADLGKSMLRVYGSLAVQQRSWKREATNRYAIAFAATKARPKTIVENLPAKPDIALRSHAQAVNELVRSIRDVAPKSGLILDRATSLFDKLSTLLVRRNLSPRVQRDALLWREYLDQIRNTLLGVRVAYRISDTVVTDRQVLFFTVDSVSGLIPGGSTELYIPAVESGWAVNESLERKHPLVPGEEIRLLSPQLPEYDLPHQETMSSRPALNHMLYVFVMHRAAQRNRSFSYRIAVPLLYAPRFTAEVLTPIVPATPGVELNLRLTNHSRDGISDVVQIRDTMVTCAPQRFRLSEKEASASIMLRLVWRDALQDSTYIFPIQIGTTPVARFAARKFRWNVDTTKHIAVLAGIKESTLTTGLRRLGLNHVRVVNPESASISFQGNDVVCLDRRFLSFAKKPDEYFNALMSFADSGGHLVVFSQEAAVWNASLFGSLFKLAGSERWDAQTPVELDENSDLISNPNHLHEDDFTGFIVRRNHNTITGSFGQPILKHRGSGNPIILTKSHGRGRVTYVDLALQEQLLNVNPGMFRLLANLVSLSVKGSHH